ncbi:hypothetical protein QBC47DRAFT_155922 [Echria macrotheca]|uniref:Zn(2)-C6 fungal-type domain-containing protein n=1 Tax=Echria macrotheca TaxID=438768 RepID=A0AAJ0FBJ8_9PEZI|nr:hypothetical protein QBC47DRAFT_155922 [Echria macrotheca]
MSSTTPPLPSTEQAGSSLRRLLPASPPAKLQRTGTAGSADGRTPSPNPRASPAASSDPSNQQAGGAPRRKRQATTAACGACRRRKSKCNGERPKCSVCRDRGTECEFDTNATETHTQALKRKFVELQSQKTTYEQLFEFLQFKSDRDAKEIFRRIRAGADIHSILRYVNYGDPLVQLAVVPEARYRYEFPFVSEMPALLIRPDNPYLDSKVYEFSLRPPLETKGQSNSTTSSSSPEPVGDPTLEPYLKPFHAVTMLDPLLDAVKPSKWTSVSSDDTLLRKLLHEYFVNEHECFTVFHKDFFLQDMANMRPRFCSQLLVNAVLCMGCYCYRGLEHRAEHWNPKNIGYQFLAEARRLYEYETDLDDVQTPSTDEKRQAWAMRKLTTIQAAMVLALVYACNGADRVGWRFTLRAAEMAYEIQLFQPRPEFDTQAQCVWDYTAWCLFSWESLCCFHYFRPPLSRSPPEAALPNPVANPGWYGETWVRYPQSNSRLSTCHPQIFKAKAELWAIANEYTIALNQRAEPHNPLPMSEMLLYYKKLNSWFDNLPESLGPRKIVFPKQLMLHMQYYLILITIVKPVIDQDWGDGTIKETPRWAYFNAMVRYETLIRLYYLRHSFDAPNTLMINYFGHLNQIALDAMNGLCSGLVHPDESHLRSTALLSAKGLYDQSHNHYIAKVVFKMQLKQMREKDVELLKHIAKIESDDANGPLEQPVQSEWPLYNRSYHEDYQSISRGVEALSLDQGADQSGESPR